MSDTTLWVRVSGQLLMIRQGIDPRLLSFRTAIEPPVRFLAAAILILFLALAYNRAVHQRRISVRVMVTLRRLALASGIAACAGLLGSIIGIQNTGWVLFLALATQRTLSAVNRFPVFAQVLDVVNPSARGC